MNFIFKDIHIFYFVLLSLYLYNNIIIHVCQYAILINMMAFNHILAGSIIGATLPPLFSAPIALASHFLLDLTPHSLGETERPYSRQFIITLSVDIILSLGCIIAIPFVFPNNWLHVYIGAFFGLLPDFLWPLWHKGSQWLDIFLHWAARIQWGERSYGWLYEGVYGVFLLASLQFIAQY